MTDILDKLADLYKQATEERSHNYTGAVIKEAITHIAGLRALAAISQRTEPQAQCSAETAEDVLNGIRDALESRGYFHMANGRDIGALLDEPQEVSEPGSMRAQWTFDAEARAYYFAPLQASPPPYTTREVTAILDIANDGTLAGVEICEMRSTLPEPPLTSSLPRPQSESGK